MNLTALKLAIDRRTGVAFDDTALTDVVNEALHAISTENDWPWLEASETITTTAGDGSYAPAARWYRTRGLQIDGYEPMRYVTVGSLDDFYIDSNARGVPTEYTIYGDELLLRPIPDAAYSVTHRYYKTETDLSAGGDSPLMPSQYHHSIVEWAAALVLDREGERDKAQARMERARDWLRRMEDNKRRGSAPISVRVRPGGYI